MRSCHQSVENVVFVLLAEDICVVVALLHVDVLKWVVWFAACRLFECQGWLWICRSMSGGLWKIDWVVWFVWFWCFLLNRVLDCSWGFFIIVVLRCI